MLAFFLWRVVGGVESFHLRIVLFELWLCGVDNFVSMVHDEGVR